MTSMESGAKVRSKVRSNVRLTIGLVSVLLAGADGDLAATGSERHDQPLAVPLIRDREHPGLVRSPGGSGGEILPAPIGVAAEGAQLGEEGIADRLVPASGRVHGIGEEPGRGTGLHGGTADATLDRGLIEVAASSLRQSHQLHRTTRTRLQTAVAGLRNDLPIECL